MPRDAPTPLPAGPLPDGARILHIGPSKTGTTALQGACCAARADLARQGVHYAGNRRHAVAPARAAAGTPAVASDERKVPSMRWWTSLVREMQRTRARRVLYSSEFLAHADEPRVRRILGDVGQSAHVAITLRPLDAVLTSKWQQSVQSGSTQPLEEWLRAQLAADAADGPSSLWQMHHHGRLVERWAREAGPERVTVVVADPRNHAFLFRAFEGLLGLEPGTLRPVDGLKNRSLTMPEVELVRQLNLQARAAGVRRGARNYLVIPGAARNMKRRPAPAGAARPRLPDWALDRSHELAQESLAGIRASGVQVVGSLDLLLPRPAAHTDRASVDPPDLRLDAETAAAAALGVAYGTGLRFGERQPDDELLPLPFMTTKELLRIVARRARRRLRTRVDQMGLPDE